ncbi:MAG: formyltransferase family protein [Thermodesulfobacteriota bacterium]|nr:formyltransferase family protein [Thermodesulfobacteriota bacterium]
MIFLFCNETYGQLFLQTAKKFLDVHNIDITIVFSGKRRYLKNPLERSLSWSLHFFKNKLKEINFKRDMKMRLFIIENVNSPYFYRRIQPNDHGIIAGFNQIFKQKTISKFKSLVNFHPSILPFYRGPVPTYWCIKNCEERTGYTLHRITEKIDDGEILFQEVVPIGTINDPVILVNEIATHAAPLFWRYLDHLRTGEKWDKVQLDAANIYKNHINYASFPN